MATSDVTGSQGSFINRTKRLEERKTKTTNKLFKLIKQRISKTKKKVLD